MLKVKNYLAITHSISVFLAINILISTLFLNFIA